MKQLTKNQFEVVNLFRKNIFLKESILGLMRRLNKKSYQRIYEAVRELEKNTILKIEKFGSSNIVELNLSSSTIALFSYLDETEALSKKILNIEGILELKDFADDIILVAGSYAKGAQTKASDIDLTIITKDDAFKKQKRIENVTLSYHPQIHPVTFTHKDFIDMLLSKEENFGREVFKNHLILRNASKYYELLKEAVRNGFKG